jgi:hypothetical protein
MSKQLGATIAVIGIDIGKNSFHVGGLDHRGAIVLRQRWSRGQVESRFANMPPCLIGIIGIEACVGARASHPPQFPAITRSIPSSLSAQFSSFLRSM